MFISLYVVTHPLFASYTTHRCPLKRSLTGALLTEKSTKVPQENAAVISSTCDKEMLKRVGGDAYAS